MKNHFYQLNVLLGRGRRLNESFCFGVQVGVIQIIPAIHTVFLSFIGHTILIIPYFLE